MSRVVEHLAELTGFRDRDVLDASLAGALKDLLAPLSVAIHRCVGESGAQHWITRARLTPQDLIASADPVWSEISSLPLLDQYPERLACLQSRQPHLLAGTPNRAYFPLTTEGEGTGVLQIDSEAALSVEDRRLVASILRIYRNFQGLLDYSERDTLTGLLNRKTFDDSFLRLISQPADRPPQGDEEDSRRAADLQATLWLGVIDIDHFKRVNDNHGHLIGDEVLLLMSRLMRSTFRYQDQLYRFGGEEFVVLMRCASGPDAAVGFERLRANVERHVFPQIGRITISIGFTDLRAGDSPAACFERADKAVYFAKQNGRNQVHLHADLVAAGKLEVTDRDSDVEFF